MKLDSQTRDAATKLILRFISLPLLPGPEIYALIRSVRRSEQDIDVQVRDAFDALSKSSHLIENLGGMLKDREEKLKGLQAEYERISQLSTLTAAQADAISASLKNVIGASATRERLYAFLISIAASLIIFVFGVIASDTIKGALFRVFG